MTAILETASASASGSLIAFFLIRLWKKIARRIKVKGLILNDRNNWESLEPFSNEDILFINLKKALGKDYPSEMIRSDVRLKVFPLAKKYVENLKDTFKKKTFVIISDDIEMLHFVGVNHKNTKAILPSEKLIQELHKEKNDTDYNKVKLETLSILNKDNIFIVDKNEDIINVVRNTYKVHIK